MQIQRTLISLLNVRSDNTTTHQNATVAELIGEKYCENENTFGDINSTVQNAMKIINKPDYHFIFSFCPKDGCSGTDDIVCSPDVVSKFGKCCIKTENINVARLQLNIPKNCTYSSDKYAIIEIGIWPNNLEVEPCE